jgi:hypothetical protein
MNNLGCNPGHNKKENGFIRLKLKELKGQWWICNKWWNLGV